MAAAVSSAQLRRSRLASLLRILLVTACAFLAGHAKNASDTVRAVEPEQLPAESLAEAFDPASWHPAPQRVEAPRAGTRGESDAAVLSAELRRELETSRRFAPSLPLLLGLASASLAMAIAVNGQERQLAPERRRLQRWLRRARVLRTIRAQ